MPPVDRRVTSTANAYDAVASDYQQLWRERRPLDAVRRFAGLAGRGARILDVACGPALDIRLLRDGGLKVFAGDRGHEVLKLAKTFFPKGALARWDLRHLPFPDAAFGGVWARGGLQHLPRSEIRPALEELRRVHHSGPIFVSFREGAGDLEPFEDPPAGPVFITPATGEELRALLLAVGYTEVEVETRPDPLERPGVTWLYGWGRLTP
jgi:ubiquinone/menaquinone biosynthesis C-methylase UbiE